MNQETQSFEDQLRSKPMFTLREFATLCRRSPRWAYDRAYAGDINVMQVGGVTSVSASEVRRFLTEGMPYRGKRPTPSKVAKT